MLQAILTEQKEVLQKAQLQFESNNTDARLETEIIYLKFRISKLESALDYIS